MRRLIWGKRFIKSCGKVNKKYPDFKKNVEETLKYLIENPFNAKLETHKLKGKLAGTWACSIAYDLRIVFDFVKKDKSKEEDILLIDIGTHDEVY